MATTFTQQNRLLSLTTPLGKDKLLLRSLAATEGMSRLFSFQLDLLSEDPSVNFDDMVGKPVTVGVVLADGASERYFHGYVSRFAQLPSEGRLARYQAELVPYLWFLTRTADCRIYQQKSIPDIIKDVFQRYGLTDFEDKLQRSYQPWDYCVQYRETAFNFVTRLMEQEGIFYFFRHEKNKHTLVLGDSSGVHQPCPNQEKARYEHGYGEGYAAPEDYVMEWRLEHELRPGKYATTDYNFETPSTSLMSNVNSTIDQGGNSKFEVYDFPGEYEKRDEGEAESKLRIEEEEAAHAIITGSGTCRAFTPGFRFELTEHDREDQNKPHLITSVTHTAREGGFYSGIGGEEEATYENSFTCIPYAVTFRPPRVTPKPVCQGSQTAVVVGPAGEEIYTDKHGRVKVQFHWDRLGKKDANSSCWVRVSHPWAGKNWGAISIPRIGQEVIVDFLEGDPDRPIITGRVYNAEQMPPYDLPANMTQTGIKSRSSKGGGGDNFNELRFEDKKGQEEVYFHAEKNMTIVTENDKNQTTGHDETLSIGHDRTKTVKNNESSTIVKNRTETVGENETITIVKNRTETVGENETITIGKNRTEIVAGQESITIGKDRVEIVGNNESLTVGNNRTETVTKELTVSAGMKVSISAGVELTLTGPGGSIKIDASGVTVQGVLVKIN